MQHITKEHQEQLAPLKQLNSVLHAQLDAANNSNKKVMQRWHYRCNKNYT